ncbi:MAG: hypothetical protein AAB425_10370, partial [Bdellovibrionota bacterium]
NEDNQKKPTDDDHVDVYTTFFQGVKERVNRYRVRRGSTKTNLEFLLNSCATRHSLSSRLVADVTPT